VFYTLESRASASLECRANSAVLLPWKTSPFDLEKKRARKKKDTSDNYFFLGHLEKGKEKRAAFSRNPVRDVSASQCSTEESPTRQLPVVYVHVIAIK